MACTEGDLHQRQEVLVYYYLYGMLRQVDEIKEYRYAMVMVMIIMVVMVMMMMRMMTTVMVTMSGGSNLHRALLLWKEGM